MGLFGNKNSRLFDKAIRECAENGVFDGSRRKPEKRTPTKVEYMCTYCGRRETRGINGGRPMPGKCSRRDGEHPHRWVINKKY